MTNRKLYEEFLKEKTVCIVGPSPSIKDIANSSFKTKQEQLAKIESYDLIVRLNSIFPIQPSIKEYVGDRTNILYHCMSADPKKGHFDVNYIKDKITWLVSSMPYKPPFSGDIDYFIARSRGSINFTVPDINFFLNLEKTLGCRPNTGFFSIMDLLSCEIKELFIIGITFFQGGYVKEYRDMNEQQALKLMDEHKNHKQEPQIELMKKVLENDSRVKIDQHLYNRQYNE